MQSRRIEEKHLAKHARAAGLEDWLGVAAEET
jgi:hypothetical protein